MATLALWNSTTPRLLRPLFASVRCPAETIVPGVADGKAPGRVRCRGPKAPSRDRERRECLTTASPALALAIHSAASPEQAQPLGAERPWRRNPRGRWRWGSQVRDLR